MGRDTGQACIFRLFVHTLHNVCMCACECYIDTDLECLICTLAEVTAAAIILYITYTCILMKESYFLYLITKNIMIPLAIIVAKNV